MKACLFVTCFLLAFPLFGDEVVDQSRELAEAAMESSVSWEVLEHLTDSIGSRLSGSEGAGIAVGWTTETLRNWGLYVRQQPVMVPHWVRGNESAVMTSHRGRALSITTLGGSIATPSGGIEAEVVEVASFAEIGGMGNAMRGRIVLLNEPMERELTLQQRSFEAYSTAVAQRSKGPSLAAKEGAVAVLVRSVTTRSLRTPHTGALSYDKEQPKIPAAAVSTEDADSIHRLLVRGETVRVRLTLGAEMLPDVESANVIAEIPGRENPEEVVVIGGHLDSWDTGTGAIDNGVGVAVVMETMRLIHESGMVPRRTIRAVLFMNEENGLRGAKAFHDENFADLERYVAAIEHDSGVGRPRGFETTLRPDQVRAIRPWLATLDALGADLMITSDSVAADMSVLRKECVTTFEAAPANESYFDYHHSAADTLDKVDPELLRRNAAAFVVLTWVLADMPDRLPGWE